METFQGKTAVVTGAASGIGHALALRFCEEGMNVVLADIEPAALTAAVSELESSGYSVCGVVTDVAKPEQVSALADAAFDTFGGAHIVCNNAGIFTGGLLWEESLADYQWSLDVNLWGVIHGVRAFVPRMIDQGEPCHVVNTASMAALTTMPFAGVYHMTKHAVLAFSESLYHELALTAPQVGVSVLCPELIKTGIANCDRNRPAQYSGEGDIVESDARTMVHDSIASGVSSGLPPREMAERVLEAVKDNRFYILSNDGWMESARTRIEDILQGRNPTLAPPDLT
ncbi:SDR family NAD(P)-dependent oxidoreductase [Halioglobus pacificus]|uniref:Short-chain dehydrogenase n=1 Tax=Parahalioglobus pacificus TaxID=930806 RepID=A0A919CJM1_9GAMM|nr:SDR family NAD(P)-dependent oxidoreductase [Halioglobus pacificus]GHD31341.1 short-chain dehydrogenase [Halioglobus pacificus]